MKQSNIAIIVYIAGVIIGALFLDIWGAETNIKKGLIALGWTALLIVALFYACLLYTSDAADDLLCVDLGGRRIIKKK